MNRGRKEKKERRKGEGERTQQKKDIPLIEGWTDDRTDFNSSRPVACGVTHKMMPSWHSHTLTLTF